MPALALYNYGSAVFSAIGETKKAADLPLLCRRAECGAQPVLCHLLPILDVVGVALASALSRCVSAWLILRALTRVQDTYALDWRSARLDPAMTRHPGPGSAGWFQNAVFAICKTCLSRQASTPLILLMVKGNSAAANADALLYDVMAAFYMACASFMSQNYGAGKIDRVKKSFVISLGYSFGRWAWCWAADCWCLGGSSWRCSPPRRSLTQAWKRITVMALAYCISAAFMDCTIAAARGLGHTVVPTIIVILGSCVFRVIWVCTIFAHFHPFPALYLLYPAPGSLLPLRRWSISSVVTARLCGSMHRRPDCFASAPAGALLMRAALLLDEGGQYPQEKNLKFGEIS